VLFHVNLTIARRHNGRESIRTTDPSNDDAALAGHGHELPDPALSAIARRTTNGTAPAQQTHRVTSPLTPGTTTSCPSALAAQGAVLAQRYRYRQTPPTSVVACACTPYAAGQESGGRCILRMGTCGWVRASCALGCTGMDMPFRCWCRSPERALAARCKAGSAV
jgi:hypothetical protein